MSEKPSVLSIEDYRRAVSTRDLTCPSHGPHAMQLIVDAAIDALAHQWSCSVIVHRANPVVPIEDNYDRLRYPAGAAAREARYTRYVSDALLLRTQTSAMIPPLLESLARERPRDVLLACPGICYRRDSIDRLHTGEPHQLDLWRLRDSDPLTVADLREMIAAVIAGVLPGRDHRSSPAVHPYTVDGLQIDVRDGDDWVEVGECGLAHPQLLASVGLDPGRTSGLAMGLGLDRIVMLRKRIPDIRLLRAKDDRVSRQMRDLGPYRQVSNQPAIRRDLSIAIAADADVESLGDRVRRALGDDADKVEVVEVLSETPIDQLPPSAVARMGMRPGHKNALVRVVLRDVTDTLTHAQANALRDRIYLALHEGDRDELAAKTE